MFIPFGIFVYEEDIMKKRKVILLCIAIGVADLVLLLGIAALILYLIFISLPSISEGPEDDPSWYMDVEPYEDAELLKEASDYIFSDADSCKIVIGESYIAYITTDNRVYYVMNHGGGAVDSGYIPGAVNANAVFGNGWLVFVLDDTGTVSAFNVLDGEHIELSGEMIGPFYDELSKCNGHVEDMYYTSPDCWAIRSDSKWVCSDTLDWVDWSRVVEIAGNGTGSAPAMALYSDGRVYLNTDGSSYDEILYSKTESWTDVSHIADGLAPFGLTEDGRLLTVSNAYYLASDINDWNNIIQISAQAYITAGLKNDGTVEVEVYEQSRNYEDAESWTDVRYIQVTPFHIFGVTGEGRFLYTEAEAPHDNGLARWMSRNEYPCSMLAACYMTDSELDAIKADNMIKPENVTELSFGDGSIDMSSFAKADDVITYTGDFDGDGADDELTVDYSAVVKDSQGIGNIFVTSSEGKEYWRGMFALPSAGWTSYYVTEIEGRSYLIYYYPPRAMQGQLFYSCQIFTFGTDGKMVCYDEFGGRTEEGVNEFSARAGLYLPNAVHLVSTYDGELITF